MRALILWLAVALAACTAGEPERHTATADIDLTAAAEMLMAIDAVTENDIDIDALLELTRSVPMDEEKQAELAVTYGGDSVELFYHVWREEADWVHIYASSTSKPLVEEIQAAIGTFARHDEQQ